MTTSTMTPDTRNPESSHARAPSAIPTAAPMTSPRRKKPPRHTTAGTVTTARLCGFWTDSVGGLLRTNTQASEAEDIKSSCDADRGPHESGNTIQVTQKKLHRHNRFHELDRN